MYEFQFKPKFKDLKASGEDNKLVISSSTEEATVEIVENRISKVEHKDLKNQNTIEVIEPVKSLNIGEKTHKRDVFHFLLKGSNGDNQIRLGQTVHVGEGGTWSSLPHDFENYPEEGFEEVFFYLLTGGPQRAIQVGRGLWNDGEEVEDSWFVSDRSFSPIPMGYHPVVGEPGVQVSYIWAYLCIKEEWEKV